MFFYMFAYLGRKLMDVIGFRIARYRRFHALASSSFCRRTTDTLPSLLVLPSLREGREFKRKQLQEGALGLPMLVAITLAVSIMLLFALPYHYSSCVLESGRETKRKRKA